MDYYKTMPRSPFSEGCFKPVKALFIVGIEAAEHRPAMGKRIVGFTQFTIAQCAQLLCHERVKNSFECRRRAVACHVVIALGEQEWRAEFCITDKRCGFLVLSRGQFFSSTQPFDEVTYLQDKRRRHRRLLQIGDRLPDRREEP